MAKTISDEVMKFSLEINGDPAQKQLHALEGRVRELTAANKGHLLQKQLLEKQGKTETEQYRVLTATMAQNSQEIKVNKNRMKELQDQIGITGLTMSQLSQKAHLLKMSLLNAIPGSEAYKRYTAELSEVNARLSELKGKSLTAKTSIASLADSFNRYQGMAIATIGALTGVVLSVQKIIDINGKLSDAQSDVMKTTGLTKIEVDELTKSFGLLQTRTSRINLLGIAEQGGRIGIAKAEIGDFVSVMNKASVSLGDSFQGGAEEVATKLGKIKFLFQETKDLNVDQAYNSIGSAINDLGANGVASEANIADFTTRIGSLTDVLKPTIQQTLALGTAFEESGIESEVSARAYGIFMKQASTETAKFAKVMNLTQGEVETMINNNPLEFMLKFSEGMKGMSATDTAKTLDTLGIAADGANKVIGAMGNNTARFRELIDLSNNSFASGTSLINEYNIKNNNLAATLEKISKTVSGWFSSETFIKWLTLAVGWFASFIGATEESEKKVSGFRTGLVFTAKLLGVLIATLFGYSVAVRIAAMDSKSFGMATAWANIQSKAQALLTSLNVAWMTAYTTVMKILGIETKRTAAYTTALNLAQKTNPILAVIGVVLALVAAYKAYSSSINTAVVEQDSFSKQQKKLSEEVGKSTAATKAHLSSLVTVINDTNVSLETRKKAYEELVKIAPEFNGLIIKEGEKVNGLLAIYADYINALDQVARAKALAKLNESNIEKEINAAQRLYNAEKKLSDEKDKFAKGAVYTQSGVNIKGTKSVGISNAEKELSAAKSNLSNAKKIVKETTDFKNNEVKETQDRININEKALNKLEKQYGKEVALKSSRGKQLVLLLKADKQSISSIVGITPTDPNVKSDYNALGGDDKADKSGKKLEDKNKKLLEDAKKLEDDKLKIQREAEDARLANLPEGYTKENAIEQANFDRKITDLKNQLVKEEDIKSAFANASNPKLSEADRAWWKAQAELWEASNKANNSKIESATQMHNTKLGIINEKAQTERIQKEQEQYDLEKMQRETAFNNEINALDLSDAERKKRQDAFNKNELKITKAHLVDKIALLKAALADGLFSPEVQAKMEKQLAFLENAASKIENVKDPKSKSKTETIGDAAKSAFGETDVLGYTPDQWTGAFDNLDSLEGKLTAVGMVVQGMQNLWAVFANYQNASDAAQLQKFEKNSDAKKTKLKKQLDSGVISQKNYDKQVSKIDEELENKKADLDYKRAKREKAMALVGAIISTAKGIATALPNLILAGIAAVVGGLQIATIAKQPLPAKGHEEGLYQDYVTREQDGKKFKSSYGGKTRSGLVSKTSHFLVAENGPEMVIDNKAWRQMNPEVKDSLIRELRGIKGFEQGLYNQAVQRYEVPASSTPASSGGDAMTSQMLLAVIAENTAVLKDLRDNGTFAVMTNKDLKAMGYIKDGINAYDELRTKSKK